MATNAVQFTPFPTIDVWLAAHEEFNLPQAMVWTRSHARLEQSLSLIYNSLYQAMMFIPLFLIFKKSLPIAHITSHAPMPATKDWRGNNTQEVK